jgi:hypothetical protein
MDLVHHCCASLIGFKDERLQLGKVVDRHALLNVVGEGDQRRVELLFTYR